MMIEGYFFLLLIETICCDQFAKLSRRDSSAKGSQYTFLCRIKNILNFSLAWLGLARCTNGQ